MMKEKMNVYHTGFAVIEKPDLSIGRKNADFGQGFYLSDSREFSRRWARERAELTTYLNAYELDLSGLAVKRFIRNEEWFDYIESNRIGRADQLTEYDVIIGPIAVDTIYDTWGIITSGLLSREQSLKLLLMGPEYYQTVIKSEKGAAALRFIRAEELRHDEIAAWRETVQREELEYQMHFAQELEEMTGEDAPG